MVLAAEKALKDTKEQSKALLRQARQAVTLDEQHEIQEMIQKPEKQQRRQRQDIFKAEDEIMEKRDGLIDSFERRLAQKTEAASLFAIQRAVEKRTAWVLSCRLNRFMFIPSSERLTIHSVWLTIFVINVDNVRRQD